MAIPSPWEQEDDRIESGQAEVFPVRRKSDDQLYALKRLKNPARADRFRREVSVMEELHAAGLSVPEVVEQGLEDKRPYFVMPWFEGGAVAAQIDAGHFADDLEGGLRLLIQLAELLASLHARGRAHRDVKPENVLLKEGRPYLTDFGLSLSSKEEDPETRLTAEREGVGSRLYIAPENEAGFNEDVDQRPADFYAFGKLAWAVLAAKPPPAREQQQLAANQLATLHHNALLEPLDSLFSDMINPDKLARLDDWEVVIASLGRALDQLTRESGEGHADEDLVSEAQRVARSVRTSAAAVEARQAEEARERHIHARADLRQALSEGIRSRNEELSDISNESAPFLRIQAGDGYPIGAPPTREALLSVGLPSPPGLVVEQLPNSVLVEGSPAAIQIAVATGDPEISVIQLGLHPIVLDDRVWIVRAPQAIRAERHAIAQLTTIGPQYGSWTGPMRLGLDTTNASARALAVETIEVGIRLFNYCGEQLTSGRALSDSTVWGMPLWLADP